MKNLLSNPAQFGIILFMLIALFFLAGLIIFGMEYKKSKSLSSYNGSIACSCLSVLFTLHAARIYLREENRMLEKLGFNFTSPNKEMFYDYAYLIISVFLIIFAIFPYLRIGFKMLLGR